MKKAILLLSVLVVSIALAGCGSDTVGSNPEMPPADQRKDNNKVPFQGSNPSSTESK